MGQLTEEQEAVAAQIAVELGETEQRALNDIRGVVRVAGQVVARELVEQARVTLEEATALRAVYKAARAAGEPKEGEPPAKRTLGGWFFVHSRRAMAKARRRRNDEVKREEIAQYNKIKSELFAARDKIKLLEAELLQLRAEKAKLAQQRPAPPQQQRDLKRSRTPYTPPGRVYRGAP